MPLRSAIAACSAMTCLATSARSTGSGARSSASGSFLASVPDLNAVGWAAYGHRRGVHRILDVLARQDVRATLNVSGIMAERYPQIVRRREYKVSDL